MLWKIIDFIPLILSLIIIFTLIMYKEKIENKTNIKQYLTEHGIRIH